jgi:hypothetical protein
MSELPNHNCKTIEGYNHIFPKKKVRILVNTNADSTYSNNSVMQKTFRKKKVI